MTIEKINKDIVSAKAKITDLQKRIRTLETQKIDKENLQIVKPVKTVNLDTKTLTVFLKAYAKGGIVLSENKPEQADDIEDFEFEEYDAFVAAVESYEHTECVADMINLVANIDNYTFISDISDWDEYGRWKLREDGIDLDEPCDFVDYIDFDEYGAHRGRTENAQLIDDGHCILLDDGDPCVCPQLIIF